MQEEKDGKITNNKREVAENSLVVKDNKLIRVKRNALSLQGLKVFAYITSQIEHLSNGEEKVLTDDDFIYDFKLADYCKLFKINNDCKNKKILIKTLNDICDGKFEIERIDKENGKDIDVIEIVPMFASVSSRTHIDGQSEILLRVELNKKLTPYLFNLKGRFTKYSIKYIISLNSKYSFVLYEYLKSFGAMKSVEIYLSHLKNLFNVNHNKHHDLIRKCVEPAIAEINAKTDLNVEYEKIISGRAIAGLRFIKTNVDSEELYETAPTIPKVDKYKITHIKTDGAPETFEITGQAEVQRLIDENGFEKDSTFIYKVVGDKNEKAVNEFTFNN